ncbi:MAG: hypothetical protein FJW31_25205 [Acidobacteria bacterium]|nr:hypothetical protein [Acidobacteriota bacterium]
MNRRIEENLEAYLDGSLPVQAAEEFRAALEASGGDTRHLVDVMQKHSAFMRSALRTPDTGAEPSPGFHARVMDRIEAQRAASPFWSALLEPLFFRRLVMASATAILLLGFMLFSGGADETIAADAQNALHVIMAGEPEPLLPATTVSDGAQNRDVVLGDLTTYQE